MAEQKVTFTKRTEVLRTIGRPFVLALWLSLLFLPFGGVEAASIFCLTATVTFSLGKFLADYRNKVGAFFAKLFRIRFRGENLSPAQSSLIMLAGLIALSLFPLLVPDYYIDIAILVGIYVILALGLNVVVGFTGLLNLGFVAFYAMGAYSYALLNTRCGFDFWTALPFSVGLSAVAGLLLAIPALRLRGDYLAIVTLGFGEITRLILNNWDSFTMGPNGISGIDAPEIFSIPLSRLSHFYYLVLFLAITAFYVTRRVYTSKIGRAWVAIREDEIASSVMGVNTTLYKLYALVFGAFWAGLAGAVFAAKMRFVSPESFTFMESVLILCMVILGGLGSLWGVILGACILVLLPEILREIQIYRMLALGAGLVLLMVFRPRGLFRGRSVYIRN